MSYAYVLCFSCHGHVLFIFFFFFSFFSGMKAGQIRVCIFIFFLYLTLLGKCFFFFFFFDSWREEALFIRVVYSFGYLFLFFISYSVYNNIYRP